MSESLCTPYLSMSSLTSSDLPLRAALPAMRLTSARRSFSAFLALSAGGSVFDSASGVATSASGVATVGFSSGGFSFGASADGSALGFGAGSCGSSCVLPFRISGKTFAGGAGTAGCFFISAYTAASQLLRRSMLSSNRSSALNLILMSTLIEFSPSICYNEIVSYNLRRMASVYQHGRHFFLFEKSP